MVGMASWGIEPVHVIGLGCRRSVNAGFGLSRASVYLSYVDRWLDRFALQVWGNYQILRP